MTSFLRKTGALVVNNCHYLGSKRADSYYYAMLPDSAFSNYQLLDKVERNIVISVGGEKIKADRGK